MIVTSISGESKAYLLAFDVLSLHSVAFKAFLLADFITAEAMIDSAFIF